MNEVELPHVALTKHRTRHKSEWVEIGNARLQTDRDTGHVTVHLQMNRMPIGGFDGYVILVPAGSNSPPLEATGPRRPDRPDDPEKSVSEGV